MKGLAMIPLDEGGFALVELDERDLAAVMISGDTFEFAYPVRIRRRGEDSIKLSRIPGVASPRTTLERLRFRDPRLWRVRPGAEP